MAGGPISPCSIVPRTSGKVFRNIHKGNTNGKLFQGIGVMASLDADATVDIIFPMPPAIPSGTLKLVIVSVANETSGVAKVNPKWAAISRSGGSPDTVSLTAEGTSTITWGGSDADKLIETKITLDATTLPTADQMLVMELVFENTSSTIDVVNTHQAFLVWE